MAINVGGKDYTPEELEVLSKAGVLNIGQKNDPASTTLTAQALHGPFQGNAAQFGLFSYPGVRPQRFSALMRPDSFLALPSLTRSEYTNEMLEVMTGQLNMSGTNASGFCGNPPVVGNLKVCKQNYTWGDYYIKTDLNALALIGQLRNRADVPGEILNAGPAANPLIPDIMYNLSDARSQLALELYKIGVDMERNTELVAIQGTAATADNTYLGWFTQFGGLDGQIKTGYTDAATGIACPAMDSAVVSFNADIAGTSADGSGRDIVEVLTETVRGLKRRGMKVGMADSQWAILMRYELFSRLTDVWACTYATYRCTGDTSSPNNRDGMAIQQLRLQMLSGNYLLIDGMQVPVVFSEGIPQETLANNTYKSDIYVVPVSFRGMPLLRMEYFPMDNQYTREFASFTSADNVQTINNGLFLVGRRDTGLCVEYHFQSRMRLILEATFLAGRVDDVWYGFYEPARNALPGASLYADGGVSYRT